MDGRGSRTKPSGLPRPRGRIVGGILRQGTPIEVYGGTYVKRDDLCCDDPHLAKVRGLWLFVSRRLEFKLFALLDGRYSRNGWALARVCNYFNRQSIVFWPILKSELKLPILEAEGPTRRAASAWGAEAVALPARRSAVVYAAARRHMEQIARSCLVPNAVKIEETVEAHHLEVVSQVVSWGMIRPQSLIVPVGTGTILCGVLSGFNALRLYPTVYAVLGYSQNETRLRKYIASHTKYPQERIVIVDQHQAYGSETRVEVPFPACPHYEAKAWEWLQSADVRKPIAFWNAGD